MCVGACGCLWVRVFSAQKIKRQRKASLGFGIYDTVEERKFNFLFSNSYAFIFNVNLKGNTFNNQHFMELTYFLLSL